MTIHTDGKPTVSNAERKRVLPAEAQTSVILPHEDAKRIARLARRGVDVDELVKTEDEAALCRMEAVLLGS